MFHFSKLPEISPRDAAGQLDNPEVIWLDVREVAEFRQATIPGSRLIPLGFLPLRERELTDFRHRMIIVFCHSGSRSSQATRWLNQRNFQAENLRGGLIAWHYANNPLIRGDI